MSHGLLRCLQGHTHLSESSLGLCDIVRASSTLRCSTSVTLFKCDSHSLLALNHIPLSLQRAESESDEADCKACDPSCLGCRGASRWNCTACLASQILADDGRCLSCCGDKTRLVDGAMTWECCDCDASLGKPGQKRHPRTEDVVSSVNVSCPFRNRVEITREMK